MTKSQVLCRTVALALASMSIVSVQKAFAAETLYAKIADVKVLQQPELKSPVVGTLAAGAQLEGLQKKGLFWKVKAADGTTGYVMMTLVSTQSAAAASQVSGAMRALLTQKRATDSESGSGRARSKNAVMGIRGLASEDLSQVGNLRPNLQALEMLETWTVAPSAVEELEAAVLSEALSTTH